MGTLESTLIMGGVNAVLDVFIKWQERKSRVEGWKPSPADREAFIAEIRAATPDAVKAMAAAELGVQWTPAADLPVDVVIAGPESAD